MKFLKKKIKEVVLHNLLITNNITHFNFLINIAEQKERILYDSIIVVVVNFLKVIS